MRSQVPVDAEPGKPGNPGVVPDRGTFNASKSSEIEQKLILFGLDVYEKTILQCLGSASQTLPVY